VGPNVGPDSARRWRGDVKPIGNLTENEITLWQQLTATRHEFRSPFFSLEFARAVVEAGALARVCVLYESGTLAGLFPFQFSSRYTQAMAAGERIGGTLNDFSGVLIDRSRHASIDVTTLLRCAGLQSFEVSHFEEAQPGLGLRLGMCSKGARILIVGDREHYWQAIKSRHPSYYDTLTNRERKAARELRSFEFVFAHEEPAGLIKEIIAAKRQQYERTRTSDALDPAWKLLCLDQIARHREGRCIPVVSVLYVAGDWAALHLGVRAANVLHYWFPVYNPRFGSFSPGLLLLAKMIREAASQGVGEIDLGEGVSRYKSLFATEFYPIYRDFWYRLSPRGLASRGYVSLLWRTQAMRRNGAHSVGIPTEATG
jgi:CelD/BcsL family acetyltransferase involved in cellulose biosynthesis